MSHATTRGRGVPAALALALAAFFAVTALVGAETKVTYPKSSNESEESFAASCGELRRQRRSTDRNPGCVRYGHGE
jgi:hypothetical protein